MAQEAGVDTGIAQRQRFAVNLDGAVLQRADQFLGGVHQGEQVAAVVPAHAVGRGDEHFERGIAGARAHAGQAGVDADRAVLHRDDGVGDAERQVVVGVDPALGFGLEHPVIGGEAGGVLIHGHGPAAVRHIDALRAIAFHQQRLLRQRLGRAHVAHHQEARDVHAEVPRRLDVLLRYVCLGAVGGDADRAHAHFIGVLQVMDRADAGQQQGGQHRAFQHFGHRADPVPVGMGAKAVVEAGARQAIAVGHLDGVHPGPVERAGNGAHVVQPVLVANGVHPVAQGDVLDIELVSRGVEAHAATPSCMRSAIFSAVFSAAEVMMSRLPA